MKSIFLKIFLIIFLLIFYIFIAANFYTNAVCSDISNNIFRLHVIANSNSSDDQNLKYIVRDGILDYINNITKNTTSKEEVQIIVEQNIAIIQNLALSIIKNNGYDYSVKVSIGNFYFPTKSYGDITIPPGNYDALRIEIGEAKGNNWWCVMFPPLCFVDITSGVMSDESKSIIQDSLSEEEYNLIFQNTTNLKVKFKIVEVLQNFDISGIFM